jgi:L-lactate dehydrogenase complex protein LldE
MKVHVFVPCFMDQLYPETGFNMVKVLEKAGCSVVYNENQTCCGQPAFNAGFVDVARDVCAKFISDFKGADAIVCPSASCAGFVRNYYSGIFDNASSAYNSMKSVTENIHEFSSFLTDVLDKDDFGARLPLKATYHDSCAALRECRIKKGPRRLLARVDGLELVEMAETETCCGFGGSFSVKFDGISGAMADQKIHHATATGARTIISTDTSCLMHLEGYIKKKGLDMQVMHIADVLASGWD